MLDTLKTIANGGGHDATQGHAPPELRWSVLFANLYFPNSTSGKAVARWRRNVRDGNSTIGDRETKAAVTIPTLEWLASSSKKSRIRDACLVRGESRTFLPKRGVPTFGEQIR